MAKMTFSTILTKISYIFKRDSYILNHRYVIAGQESDKENIGTYSCLLNEEAVSIIKDIYPDNDIIYISNIKSAKTEPEKYIITNLNKLEISDIQNTNNSILKLIDSVKEWKNFNFTNSEIESVFSNGEVLDLFTDDKNIPTISISKSIFPTVTEKNCDSLVYYVFPFNNEEDELCKMITSIDTEVFRLHSIFYFIHLE